jgi:hypothetical protein
MNNFRYDVALDPSLFSLDPPPGYTLQKMDVTMPVEPVEEDLIRTLRTFAEYGKGMFPPKLGMYEEFVLAVIKPDMDKLQAKYGKEPSKADARKAMARHLPKPMRGLTFYMRLKPENDSHYSGGGVKLGTPDRPILWYKPTGADKYRVIYADLSVKELAADEVRKLPEARAK